MPNESTAEVEKGALFSPDRAYRYVLWRDWGGYANLRAFTVIGLNPSTADETVDDRTIRRCIDFAKREDCGRLVMLNLFALRTTFPKVMKAHAAPVGDENDATIRHWCTSTMGDDPLVVAAWGVDGSHLNRAREVRNLLAEAGVSVHCLGRNASGSPRHPLYLPGDTPLVLFEEAAHV